MYYLSKRYISLVALILRLVLFLVIVYVCLLCLFVCSCLRHGRPGLAGRGCVELACARIMLCMSMCI